MTGYAICLTDDEARTYGDYGWKWMDVNRDRWISFDFEESSIDMGIPIVPRFVVNNIAYELCMQYFVSEKGTTNRIILLKPSKKTCDLKLPEKYYKYPLSTGENKDIK